MEKVEYGGWPNCIRLSKDNVELIAATDVGPRIIRYGFVGKQNEFHEAAGEVGKTGGNEWRGYGGHRLWHAPESKPRTYYPDNSPVKYEMSGDTLRLIQDIETTTRIQKEMEITLTGPNGRARIVHKLTNRGLWPMELAPWALTVLRKGGTAVFPQEPYSPHPDIPDYPGQKIDPKFYLPSRNLIMWSYTKLSDPRWLFTAKYILLRQDPNAERPQKIGLSNRQNWGAYANNGHLFVKTTVYQEEAIYPDNGCNFETFTNADMLELESLGPVVNLAPGASVVHTEEWRLFDGVRFEETDESINANVLALV